MYIKRTDWPDLAVDRTNWVPDFLLDHHVPATPISLNPVEIMLGAGLRVAQPDRAVAPKCLKKILWQSMAYPENFSENTGILKNKRE